MKGRSLRARVTAFYLAMLALALMFFSVSVYGGVRAYLTRSLVKSLDNTAHSIVSDYVAQLDSRGAAWFLEEMGEAYPGGGDPFVRVSQDGRVLYASGDVRDPSVRVSELLLPDGWAIKHNLQHAVAGGGEPLMIYTLGYSTAGGAVIVVEAGSNLEPLEHLLHRLLLILLVVTPGVLVIAAFGGYFLMARALRPVVVLTEQTERVGRKQMGERLAVIPTGDELERLSLGLNRMIDRLEEALAHNQRFTADASHELRTPLTIIRGELEGMMEIPGLPADAVEGIGSALEEGERMSRIVHSLMTISRLDGGGERMEMRPVELSGLLRGTLDQMSLLAEEKGILLVCASNKAVDVAGDAMRLKQVIVNLVDNAIRYTPEGGRIDVRLGAESGWAVLVIADTGIGIAAESLPFVFDRFYRTDEARSRESGGTGLGLAIVKAICGAHDGRLSVESVEGKGTTFRVELPML